MNDLHKIDPKKVIFDSTGCKMLINHTIIYAANNDHEYSAINACREEEAAHELGYSFGLGHCKNMKCVMHFSNSLSDTDIKTSHFCNVCKAFI